MIIVSLFLFQGYAQFDHQYEVMFKSLKDIEIDESNKLRFTNVYHDAQVSSLHTKEARPKVSFFILPGCRARVDIAFIIDGSGSIEQYGRGNFRRCLNFVKAIVRGFNTDNGQTRVGVVLFSSRPRLIFGFRRYRRKNQLLTAISRIRYPRGGTKTGYAMRYTYYRVFRYARRGVRKVFLCTVIITFVFRKLYS